MFRMHLGSLSLARKYSISWTAAGNSVVPREHGPWQAVQAIQAIQATQAVQAIQAIQAAQAGPGLAQPGRRFQTVHGPRSPGRRPEQWPAR